MHLPWHKKGSKGGGNASTPPVAASPGWASPGSIFSVGGGIASSSSSYDRPPEFDIEYANEDHLRVFERALNANEDAEEPQVEHIRSVSDFAPIRERVKKASKKRRDVVREGWAYHVSRWPLLLFLFILIGLEFLGYVMVRQLVNVIELFSGWGGQKGRLRLRLRRAKTFEDWKAIALQLDDLLGHTSWKRTPYNAYYDSSLVRKVTVNLQNMRESGDAEGVSAILEVCLRSNFAGIENPRLYSETYYGTKDRICEYIAEVERSVEYIRHTDLLSREEKSRLFRYITKNHGSTALCLSGGASFGYYHFGVIRALLDADLIPKVVTGTSAGALVAAFLCTHTDDELRRMLIPQLAEKITACEEPLSVWAKRLYKTGARFDTISWARKAAFWTHGSTTFKEAYERTGRILNVSVIPYDTHSPTKLLNMHTAPDCLIFTAIIASAAVPGILNPVVLMTKDKNGRVKPWQFQGRHKDGSLRVDIPLQSLNLFFNVTYSIISQVNPHIHLFFFQPRGAPGRPVTHRRGKGWRGGFILSAAEQFLKLDLTKNFRVIRDLELLPELLGQNWSSVFLQKFEGSVTIWPRSRIQDWFHLLSDPDEPELARMIRVGQLVTWPKLHMISNRMRIERQIDAGRAECRLHHAQSAQRTNGKTSQAVYQPAESSLEEESDSDLDLGGPEGSVPPPDNDETLEEAAQATPDSKARKEDEEDDDDDEDFVLQRRRVASAPVSPHLARQRRRQIATSLGITTDKNIPSWATNNRERRQKDPSPTNDVLGSQQAFFSSRQGRQAPTRRRLSTGQLWLGRYNRAQSLDTAFGSGVSGDEDLASGDEHHSERSFDKTV